MSSLTRSGAAAGTECPEAAASPRAVGSQWSRYSCSCRRWSTPQSSAAWRWYTVADADLARAPHMMWADDAVCAIVTHADARLTRRYVIGLRRWGCRAPTQRSIEPSRRRSTVAGIHPSQALGLGQPMVEKVQHSPLRGASSTGSSCRGYFEVPLVWPGPDATPACLRNLLRISFEYREAVGIITDPGHGGDYGA